MKQKILVATLALILPFMVFVDATAKCHDGEKGQGRQSGKSMQQHGQKGQGGHHGNPKEIVNKYPVYDLSAEQKEAISFMWEEEKLARDVYLHFMDLYGSKVFTNISRAEQRHMNAIGALLDKYGISYPSDGEAKGVYATPKLQTLFNELVVKGELSERSAFEVGKTVELVDIADLEESIYSAEPDAKGIYNRLLKASYKHLSAFERQLNR